MANYKCTSSKPLFFKAHVVQHFILTPLSQLHLGQPTPLRERYGTRAVLGLGQREGFELGTLL